jgi:hypothetical protein
VAVGQRRGRDALAGRPVEAKVEIVDCDAARELPWLVRGLRTCEEQWMTTVAIQMYWPCEAPPEAEPVLVAARETAAALRAVGYESLAASLAEVTTLADAATVVGGRSLIDDLRGEQSDGLEGHRQKRLRAFAAVEALLALAGRAPQDAALDDAQSASVDGSRRMASDSLSEDYVCVLTGLVNRFGPPIASPSVKEVEYAIGLLRTAMARGDANEYISGRSGAHDGRYMAVAGSAYLELVSSTVGTWAHDHAVMHLKKTGEVTDQEWACGTWTNIAEMAGRGSSEQV